MVKSFITFVHGGKHKYHYNLPGYSNLRKRRVEIIMGIYGGIVL
jgi:hypothetical protein